MKARNKITGKEITILGISKEYGTVSYMADGVLYHDNFASGALEIIGDSDPVDWSAFRREAAKDILAGAIASGKVYASSDKEGIVKYVLDYTDELIRQLKEEEQ